MKDKDPAVRSSQGWDTVATRALGAVGAVYVGAIALRRDRSPRKALELARDLWRDTGRASGWPAQLREVYGAKWMDMALLLANYLEARGTLRATGQRPLPLPPEVTPCIVLAEEILIETRGVVSADDLRWSIYSYLQRRVASQDPKVEVLSVRVGDEESYGDIARELWAMRHTQTTGDASG